VVLPSHPVKYVNLEPTALEAAVPPYNVLLENTAPFQVWALQMPVPPAILAQPPVEVALLYALLERIAHSAHQSARHAPKEHIAQRLALLLAHHVALVHTAAQLVQILLLVAFHAGLVHTVPLAQQYAQDVPLEHSIVHPV